MSDEAKRANAAAKAAKAEAKALRPFYKKKRYWVLALVAVIAVAAATSSGSSTEVADNESSNSGSSSQTEDTISSGIGSQDASSDIVDLDCGTPDALDFSYPEVTIKNNSSKASDYFVTVVFESSDGATRYDDTMIIVNSLQPGQTITESGLPVSDIPAGAICKVTEVQRTAS